MLTASFEANDHSFVALNGGPEFTFGEAISRRRGGFGARLVSDRYGVSWQVIPKRMIELVTDPDLERKRRATEAMRACGSSTSRRPAARTRATDSRLHCRSPRGA